MAKTICLVEDAQELLENITRLLVLEGFDVIACTNGADAIEKLRGRLPDLIITDLWMPVMNGFDLIDALRQNGELVHVPIVVFSAAPLRAKEKESLHKNIDGYILKPATMDFFLDSIQRFLK